MDLMRETPDNYFDLAIVDPPYGIGADTQKESWSQGKNGEGRRHRKSWSGEWDKEKPPPEYFVELRRVSTHQIIWGGNYFELSPSRCWLMWDKVQSFTGSDFELAWTSMDSAAKAFRMSRIEAYSKLNGGHCSDKIHPTQKPVSLYKWILANYAKPGQRILDTHMGSGSIAIACHYFGAHLTATEIDEDYFTSACERIENETRQMDLFQENASQQAPKTEK